MVFFCFVLGPGCHPDSPKTNLKVVYEGNKAVAIQFYTNSADGPYKVFLGEGTKTPILGALTLKNNRYIFKPIVPFTEGESYSIYRKNTLFSEFYIKENKGSQPELMAIYPTRDTVPENLLKMYFVFSEPMQEVGNPLDYISIKNKTDQKEETIFLDLEAQLWNAAHTELTLWLDPGRIKTDLIPNKEKGLPIRENKEYLIQVNATWRSANGTPLKRTYEKHLYVSARDDRSPKVSDWKIKRPKIGTRDMLKIDFNESLDAMLLRETIQFYTTKGEILKGKIKLQNKEQGISFYPDESWKKGDYKIQIAAKLEDLAGNNLNHVFDRDLDKSALKSEAVLMEFLDFKME